MYRVMGTVPELRLACVLNRLTSVSYCFPAYKEKRGRGHLWVHEQGPRGSGGGSEKEEFLGVTGGNGREKIKENGCLG